MYQRTEVYNIISVSLWDWLLIIGVVFSPMTALRIWKIGPGEVLCFIWCFNRIGICYFKKNYINTFFLSFLYFLLIGTIICLFVAPSEISISSWPTWIYLFFIAYTIYQWGINADQKYLVIVLDRMCFLSTIWFGGLYFYSVYVDKTLFGVSLWFSSRYAGGATNPHQLALLMCGAFFWHIHRFIETIDFRLLFAIALSLYILNETKSSTGKAAIVLGLFSLFFALFIDTYRKSSYNSFVLIVGISISTTLLLIFIFLNKNINQLIYEWIANDPNGLGRFYIWSSIRQAFLKSPLFGLGPGTHGISYSGMKELHNSYLEILAATGVAGLFSFIVFSAIIIQHIYFYNPRLITIVITLYGYSIGGFAFRRLPYWVLLMMVMSIVDNNNLFNKQTVPNDIHGRKYLKT